MSPSQRLCRCVTETYFLASRVDVLDTDDADADTDDDAGPCEDIVVLAKTHSGTSEDTYCGSDDDDDDDDELARTGTGENRENRETGTIKTEPGIDEHRKNARVCVCACVKISSKVRVHATNLISF